MAYASSLDKSIPQSRLRLDSSLYTREPLDIFSYLYSARMNVHYQIFFHLIRVRKDSSPTFAPRASPWGPLKSNRFARCMSGQIGTPHLRRAAEAAYGKALSQCPCVSTAPKALLNLFLL